MTRVGSQRHSKKKVYDLMSAEELNKGENIVKMDKGAKDKLAGSPGENGGG